MRVLRLFSILLHIFLAESGKNSQSDGVKHIPAILSTLFILSMIAFIGAAIAMHIQTFCR